MKKRESRQGIGRERTAFTLRFHMIRFMMLFLAVMIFTVWLFQTCCLGLVYERVREREMETAARSIEGYVGSGYLEQAVYSASRDGIMSILVYRIDGDQAIRVAMGLSDVEEEKISLTSPKGMAELYAKAKESDGAYHAHLTFGGKEIHQSLPQRLFPWFMGGDARSGREVIHMVYVHLCEDASGGEYMLLLNTALEPMTPLVHTLQRQFFWIFSILMVDSRFDP